MSPEVRSVGKRLVVYLEDNVIKTCSGSYALTDFALDSEFSEVYDLSFILRRLNIREINFS